MINNSDNVFYGISFLEKILNSTKGASDTKLREIIRDSVATDFFNVEKEKKLEIEELCYTFIKSDPEGTGDFSQDFIIKLSEIFDS